MRSREIEIDLEKLGFARCGAAGEYRRNGTALRWSRHWCTLTAEDSSDRDEASAGALVGVTALGGLSALGGLGSPGLWKRVATSDGRAGRCVFDLPSEVCAAEWAGASDTGDRAVNGGGADSEDGADDEDGAPTAGRARSVAAIEWALATARRGPARSRALDVWRPPARADVESWIPAGGLTVSADDALRQGTIVHEPVRLAIRFPIVARIPESLPPARAYWLRALVDDAHARWRMVRVGFAGAPPSARVDAEVDLTGVPREIAEPLFRTSLDAIRWVVAWSVHSADLLVDSTIECESLDTWPTRAEPAERGI